MHNSDGAGSGRGAVSWEFLRPFTLLPPALGMISGGLCAIGAAAGRSGGLGAAVSASTGFNLLAGALMAAMLNGASNGLNQLMDLEIDRINKPGRPLPSGRMTRRSAAGLCAALTIAGLALAFLIQPHGRPDTMILAAIGMFFTYLYSGPPVRAKRIPGLANLAIAIPRGGLLVVAGWSTVAPVWTDPEPWLLGFILMLYVLGAATTKDFSDMEGDRAGGCRTLPIVLGPKKAVFCMMPFLTLPWLLLPLGAAINGPGAHEVLLSGNRGGLTLLGAGLFVYGLYTGRLLLRNPEELTRTENHPAWKHMYLMMMTAQIGLCAAYLAG